MKKLLLLFIITSTTVFSQVKVRPGVKLGLNNAKLSNLSQTESKLGLNAGMFVNLHLSSFYELQVETNYSSQGAKRKTIGSYEHQDENINLDYFNLSIANKFFPVKNNGFNLIVGPGFDILVSEKNYVSATPIDFSLFAGVGYEFPFGLGLELRYKKGLLDTRDNFFYDYSYDYYYYDSYEDKDYENDNVLNGVFQLSVLYRFGS